MMFINIISQSGFQIIVLQIILSFGASIFDVNSDRELSHYEWKTGYGYHFTIFFNSFVFLQVFNSLNSRKLNKDQLNVFKNLFNNFLFIFIQLFIVVAQLLIVQYGGRAIRTRPLTMNQHLGCIGIASFSLLCTFIIKLLPFETENENSSDYGKDLIRRQSTKHQTILKFKNN